MGFRDLVNKFTSGELDPRFLAEVDFDGYRKAGRKLRNVISLPQGGAIRRFGTRMEVTIMDGPLFLTDPEQVRLIEYEHTNDEIYDIIIRPFGTGVAFDIYLFGVYQTSVNTSAYTPEIIREIRWIEDYDRLILLHETVRPYELRWIAANNWVLNTITFQFFPTYDFTSNDNPATLPTPNTPYTSNGVTFTPNATAATTVTASIAVYTSNHVGGLYYGNSGVFRITSVNAAGTIATGYTLEDFADTSVIRGDLSGLFERAWNDGAVIGSAPAGINRGWPRHGCFYQSRLVLGGSPFLPGTAFASVTRAYYDFDDSSADPSDGWGVEAGTTGTDTIQDLLPGKSLVMLTNKGPSSTSILIDTPTTPTNAFVNAQGTESARNMDGIIVDNQIVYADRSGNTIWSMAYEIPDTGYNVNNASILSSHLIRNPRWADVFEPSVVDGRYYLLVNEDGTLAIYNSIETQNITAWTLANTLGKFIDVGCAIDQAKVLTQRKVNVGYPVALPNNIYKVDATFTAFRSFLADMAVNDPVEVFVEDGDYILIGNEIKFLAISFEIAVEASESVVPIYQFLTNTGSWETFTPSSDTTLGFSQQGTGVVEWGSDDVTNWMAQTLTGTAQTYRELPKLYWVRIKRNNDNSIDSPVLTNALVDSQFRIYMEKIDFTNYMDCQIDTTSDNDGVVGGLEPLNGQMVFVFANGFPLGEYFVGEDGQITIDTLNATVAVGLDYKPSIIPMPNVVLLSNGYSVYEPAHVETMYVDFFESLGVTVQGQPIPQTVPGLFMTDETPVPVTGFYKMPSYNGWNPRAIFEISQSYPAPMTILGVSYTVEVSG